MKGSGRVSPARSSELIAEVPDLNVVLSVISCR